MQCIHRRHWSITSRRIVESIGAADVIPSVSAAMADAGIETADALFPGQYAQRQFARSGSIWQRWWLSCGLHGTIEGREIEAACAGGAVLRIGARWLAEASGFMMW